MQTLAALESHLNTLAPISLAGWRPRAALLHDGQCRGSAEAGLRAAAAVLAAVHLAGAALPALAHVPLSPPAPSANRQSQALRQIGGRFAPAPQVQRAPDPNTHQQVQEALALLRAAADASAAGEWEAALTSYSSIVQRFPDFAVAEYARIGRALILFQLGRSDDAILQLRDEEVALRGRPEVHAALAAMLWASGRPAQRLEAERQWEVASEFDGRYARPDWVAENKHWPPLLLDALRQFLALA